MSAGYLTMCADTRPTVREAADLIRAAVDLGTVARLDHWDAALQAAYERGRADERAAIGALQ